MPKPSLRSRAHPINSPLVLTSAAAITESVLKRRWTAIVLRHVASGVTNPAAIVKLERALSLSILNQRLRTLQRYGLIARFPSPHPASAAEYQITVIGQHVIRLLDEIDKLDREIDRINHLSVTRGSPPNRGRALL